MPPADGSVEISVVSPCYNEEDNLADLVGSIDGALAPLGRAFEIVIVDDASTDSSLSVLRSLLSAHPALRVLALARRAGQTNALDAAFKATRGRFIVTIDADLQQDPADVPRLLDMLSDCDMVTGWRQKRMDNLLRRVSTKIANYVRNRLSGESIHDSACSLKVYKRACLERIRLYNGLHRFMPTLAKMQGFSVREVPVSHRPRTRGKAKYGVFNRVFRAFADLLAVRWMKKRLLSYEAAEIHPDKPSSPDADDVT